MKRGLLMIAAVVVLFIVSLLDPILKLGTGILAVLLLWLPFGLLAGFPVRPWLWMGLGCGVLVLGLWDCCDMFGLNRIAQWAHARIDGSQNT